MFDCKDRPVELSSFVGADVRQLVEVNRYRENYSERSVPEDEDVPAVLFGLEFYYLDDAMLQQLALEARTSMCHLSDSNVWQELGNTESWRLGVEVGRFFRVLIGSLNTEEDALYKEEELLEAISVVTNCLPGIGRLVEGFGGISVRRIDPVSYGYFHVALEWRWYALLLMHEVHRSVSGKVDLQVAYRELLEGLVRLAFIKFNDRSTQNELTEELQFYCPCVKNVWIGMVSLAASSGVEFWTSLQSALEKILNEMQAKSLTRTKSNSLLFQVWVVHGIASLYQYRLLDETTFKETPIITLPPDYTILDRVLKEVILGALSEDSMRTFLLLLKPIYTKWWPTKYDVVITLWEYFSKRLNSPFQLPQEPPINLACVSRSPKAVIEQANLHSTQEAFDTLTHLTSSFKSYITLMTFMLRHLSNSAQKTKVQILFNRTILRFAPPKLTSLTEQAIYNYTLLTLAMVQATPYQDDYPRLSKQMLHFNLDQLAPHSDVEVALRRITVLVLANMALTILFTERAFDKSNHLRQVLEGLGRAYRKFGDRLQTVAPIVAEAMGTVYERAFARGEFEKGDEQFLAGGDWLERYLKSCPEGELEGVMKVFSRTLDLLRRRSTSTTTTLRPDQHADFLDPLNAYVLPRIKECFTKEHNATKPIIAELAVQFTLCAPDSVTLMELVSFFAEHSTSAGLGLRLHYIKGLVGSDRMREVDERVIVRIWLKLAIQNGGEQLEELSRVVCELGEFREMCSVAEVDLCEGKDDLMGVFFKAVGDKYNEKDARGQMELSSKVNALFHQFDAWFPSPGTSLLIRIMAMLVAAIKECGQVIYKRGNSACLLHVAFSRFFLPSSVLTNRNVPNDLVLAMGKVWHRIMDVLGQMSYSEDPVLGDYVANMISKWAPQFLKFKTNADAVKPFLVFFTSRNETFVKFAFNKYLACYVELQGATPKPQAEIGLKLLTFLLEALNNAQDNFKIAMFIGLVAPSTLEHALLAHDQSPSKPVANELVSLMLSATQNGSNLIKMELKSALANFTSKHLRLDTSNYFRFMYKLADQRPEFIESLISTIRLELAETERLRGNGEDKHLRRMLNQLQGAVEASFNKANKRACL
uniref:Protein MMS22-like n=1 Tax=Culex tarsalis TaxID=7177 RepID=A0A1Q3EY11_CULTA